MEQAEATGFVKNCIHDAPAPCSRACPFGLDLRSFMNKASRGRWPAAYRELRTALVFPTIAAALCPRPCREVCVRREIGDEALDLCALENAVIRFAGTPAPDTFSIPQKDTAIAVVGAGPAGLSLALRMAQKKYPVTVFEASDNWGGILREHPDFEVFSADIATQFSLENVDFRFDTRVDSLSALDSYSAVYIATGENGNDFGQKSAWDASTFSSDGCRIFLGGALCAMPLMESIAASADVSRAMESAIQTGKILPSEKNCVCASCEHIPINAENAPHIVPADTVSGCYTKDEAKAEASRCLRCNCSACMEKCELLQTYRKPPLQMAMEVFADSAPHFLSSRTMTRQTYSCNQCGYCGSLCPTDVNMGELFLFSRRARAESGIQPAALHEFWLQELDFVNSTGFYASGKPCDAVFFPGCQLTALCPQHVLDTWHFLREKMDIGILLGCCGAPALWAGDEPRRQENIDRLLSAWQAMGKPKLITACASCMKLLRQQLPEIEIVSLYEILAALDAPAVPLPFSDAAVFTPCAARGEDQIKESVLSLAKRAGCAAETINDGGKCCGYGGHIRLANPDLYKKITDSRSQESGKPYIVYCANCLEVFRAQGKPCAHILDAVFGTPDGDTPTLSEKRQNMLKVKDALMKELENKSCSAKEKLWSHITFTLSAETRADMEDNLILDEDIQELIYLAEQSKEYFVDETGLHCASLIRPVIVYWAEYRVLEDGHYLLENAYCHRMHFDEGADV